MSPEDKAAIVVMLARIKRIDSTFVGWSERQDARLVLMAEDPWVYAQACRRYRKPTWRELFR